MIGSRASAPSSTLKRLSHERPLPGRSCDHRQASAPHLAENAEVAGARPRCGSGRAYASCSGCARKRGEQRLELGEPQRRLRRRPPPRSAAPERAERDLLRRGYERFRVDERVTRLASSRCCGEEASCRRIERLARAPQAPRRERKCLRREPERDERVAACPHPGALEARDLHCSGRRQSRCPASFERGDEPRLRHVEQRAAGRQFPPNAPCSGMAASPSRPLPRLSRIRKVSA